MRTKSSTKNQRDGRLENVEYLPTVEWRDVTLPSWASQSDQFILRKICGDSLADAGILDGDFVLIHLTDAFNEGDIISASTPSGHIVKFLSYLPDGSIRLSGPHGERPQFFLSNSLHIEGRIIRKEPA